MDDWWRTPGQSDPKLSQGTRDRVAAIARELGADRVELESPEGQVFRFARAGVCARCGEPATRDTAVVEQSACVRRMGDAGSVRRGVARPWRACKLRGCWAREVMACIAVVTFMGRLRGFEVEWPWVKRAPREKTTAELSDAEWVEMVARNMRTQKQYHGRLI